MNKTDNNSCLGELTSSWSRETRKKIVESNLFKFARKKNQATRWIDFGREGMGLVSGGDVVREDFSMKVSKDGNEARKRECQDEKKHCKQRGQVVPRP